MFPLQQRTETNFQSSRLKRLGFQPDFSHYNTIMEKDGISVGCNPQTDRKENH